MPSKNVFQSDVERTVVRKTNDAYAIFTTIFILKAYIMVTH